MSDNWLPQLIRLEDFSGQWTAYLEGVYAIFAKDFVRSKPTFCGHQVALKRFPIDQGKEATFWHFIQEGPIEEDRIPNLRRAERISWIRPLIEAVGERSDLKVWNQVRRKNERRIAIALEDFSFLIVLAERQRPNLSIFHLPWTAYPVEHEHQRRKLQREYAGSGQCTVHNVLLKG